MPIPWTFNITQSKWTQNNDVWLVGANFVPSSAVNQLEMFELTTWDPATIDRELGYAAGLGFNVMRVFLHNLLWKESDAFLKTTDKFLEIASNHNIGILFVLFDSCWNADPHRGDQPDPIPYRHNSQWVQGPGQEIVLSDNPADFQSLKSYVTGVIDHYKTDSRVVGWDLWNEPDNSGYTPEQIEPLLSQVFSWAREAAPSQPLTSPLWYNCPWGSFNHLNVLQKLQIQESDVISYHNYGDINDLKLCSESLMDYGKPVVCTEYMARGASSTFEPHLAYFRDRNISTFNWGLVSGKTQTIYPWDSLADPNPYEGVDDPDPWFHDIFLQDGRPKYQEEADYIRSITGANVK